MVTLRHLTDIQLAFGAVNLLADSCHKLNPRACCRDLLRPLMQVHRRG